MTLKLITGPVVEPVSLAEVKTHLRIDSGSFADDVTSKQSIAPGSHAIAAAYSLIGASVDVLGYSPLVILEAGINGAGGMVDVKLQESDDNNIFNDVKTGGAFTQVTTANDNETYELTYTGSKQYLRAVATVAGNACEFAVSILLNDGAGAEDTLLTSLILAAREYAENYLNRALCTQTWELILDDWPGKDYIDIPLPPLQSITSIKYKDTAGVESTFENTKYIVDTDSFLGRVVLAYGCTWPVNVLYPANPIRIQFVAGYGLAAAVPQRVKQAMLLLIGHWYENKEAVSDRPWQEIPFAVHTLLGQDRVIPI